MTAAQRNAAGHLSQSGAAGGGAGAGGRGGGGGPSSSGAGVTHHHAIEYAKSRGVYRGDTPQWWVWRMCWRVSDGARGGGGCR